MRSRTIVAALAPALALAAAAPALAERLPISSRDDETAALATRIAAVADVVATIDARLQRIEPFLPPRPIVPPSPAYRALVSAQENAAASLATTGGIACGSAGATATTGGESIADDDSRAEDFTPDGLVGQLDAVATVLGQANTRLTRIGALVGVSPSPIVIEAATTVWGEAAAIFDRAADLPANAVHTPPSPVCPTA
jgi:hypothetical protein